VGDARGVELVPLVTLMGVVLFVGLNPAVVANVINSGVLPLVTRLGA
jgi:hypothetical protein